MPSYYLTLPIVILCAPLILVVLASFTSLAIITSALAIIVIMIRLGFLAVEFSGGVALDFAGWGLKKFTGSIGHNSTTTTIKQTKKSTTINNNINNKNNYLGKSNNFDKINYSFYKDSSFGKKHIINKSGLYLNNKKKMNSPFSKHSINLPEIDVFDESNFTSNFVSNDDYFMAATMGKKRPNGKRAKSSNYVV